MLSWAASGAMWAASWATGAASGATARTVIIVGWFALTTWSLEFVDRLGTCTNGMPDILRYELWNNIVTWQQRRNYPSKCQWHRTRSLACLLVHLPKDKAQIGIPLILCV